MAGQSNGSGKRPWLAALLGTLATGLGHVYLRRWARGLGWFAAAIAVSMLFVPSEAARALLDGSGGDLEALAPILAVGVASVADAYVLARLRQREAREHVDGATPPNSGTDTTTTDAGSADVSTAATERAAAGTSAECSECGKELDPDLDFCPWCTTRLRETGK